MEGDDRRSEQSAAEPAPGPAPAPTAPPAPRPVERPVLPDVSRDETAEGWGEAGEGRDEQWYREQRPPHWE
jgi:hypothetical protein